MPNALARETSPYLRQHADNPVAWLPWGDEALARARAEEKPIFLSIGYSTCHWCHVMARESFENPEAARLLNEHFIPIKVDREERPDVDKVYMAYVQAMTGRGGWPLSAWLTPDLKPFYGGTYFPPEDRHGRAGFVSLLRAIAQGWRDERDKLVSEGERAINTLREYHTGAAHPADTGETLSEAASAAFERCLRHLSDSFDLDHGGFGGAPKFPRAANLNFLFRVAALQGPDDGTGAEAARLAATTLRAMARGGVHDHVGGGYHRYSVDAGWFVPHFEKMLYDQAQIALNCLDARQATGDERFAWMARDIFDYVARDLTSPEGGFFTAEDADSAPAPGSAEHAEGAFYVWTAAELRDTLGADSAFFASHFGVEEEGNVPASLDPQDELRGKNILAQRRPLSETARLFSLTLDQANDRQLACLEKLRALRAHRPRPLRDDKIVTATNGLMISALARAHQILGPGDGHLAAAIRAAGFVERELHDATSATLFRSWCGGRRGAVAGFAEDYAFFIQGLLDLHEASFDARWLLWADRLQTTMDRLFWEEEAGGYFNSAAGDPSLVLRLKEDYDGAEPAPTSVAALNLLRLAAVIDSDGRRERGLRAIESLRSRWSTAPHALPQLLCALELAIDPPRHVVLAGDPSAEDFRALAAVLHETPAPRRALLGIDSDATRARLAERAPWLAGMQPLGGRATAYVCAEFTCRAPVTSPADLRHALAEA